MAGGAVCLASRLSCSHVEIILDLGDLTHPDVFIEEQIVVNKILEDDAECQPDRFQIELAEIRAVDQNAALRGIVESREKLGERCLACSILAYQCDLFSRRHAQIHMAESPGFAAGITKAYVFEDDSLADRNW